MHTPDYTAAWSYLVHTIVRVWMPFSVLPREKVTCRPDTRLMRLSQVEAACLWSPATQLLPWLRPGCFILSMNDREKALYYANWWKIYTFYTYTHTGLSVTWPWPRHHLKIFYWMGWDPWFLSSSFRLLLTPLPMHQKQQPGQRPSASTFDTVVTPVAPPFEG